MWSAYFDPAPWRVGTTAMLGRVSRRAYYGPLAPLRVRRVSTPQLPDKRWVRVRNRMAGVSSDELRMVHLESRADVAAMTGPHPPRLYLGLEVVGEVVEIGPAVQFLRPGDRVVYQTRQCCATLDLEPPCRYCAVGDYGLCRNRFLPAPQPIGAGWSEQMVLHEHQVFLVPDSLTDEQAALLEPTASAVHAALRRLPQPGDSALVIGAETTGLLTTQAVQALAPEGTAITSVARHPFQVEMAARMGATQVIFDENLSAGVARLSGAQRFAGRRGAELLVGGFDVVYDTIGSATTVQNAVRWAREGGAVVLAGRRLTPLKFDATPIWYREVDLVGAWTHGTENAPGAHAATAFGLERGGREATFQIASRLMRERKLTPERLITHRFPLREIRQALATARHTHEHRSIKVVLDMRDPTGLDQSTAGIYAEEASG